MTTMKPLQRSLAVFTALGLALIPTGQVRALQPSLRLDAKTEDGQVTQLFARFDLVAPYIDQLRAQSSARIATDPAFAWQQEDLALMEKNRATKSVSLNKADRLRERDEAEARTKTREAVRLAQKETEPEIYEITVKNSGMPDLPAPVDTSKLKAATAVLGEESDGEAVPASPAQDLQLREAQHILADYAQLLTARGSTILTKR
jgi:carboxyl-terminal processing protease